MQKALLALRVLYWVLALAVLFFQWHQPAALHSAMLFLLLAWVGFPFGAFSFAGIALFLQTQGPFPWVNENPLLVSFLTWACVVAATQLQWKLLGPLLKNRFSSSKG